MDPTFSFMDLIFLCIVQRASHAKPLLSLQEMTTRGFLPSLDLLGGGGAAGILSPNMMRVAATATATTTGEAAAEERTPRTLLSNEAFAWKTFLSIPEGGICPSKAANDVEPDTTEAVAAASSANVAVNAQMSAGGHRDAVLSGPQRLMLQYRVQKKMVLWDAVLAAAWAEKK